MNITRSLKQKLF